MSDRTKPTGTQQNFADALAAAARGQIQLLHEIASSCGVRWEQAIEPYIEQLRIAEDEAQARIAEWRQRNPKPRGGGRNDPRQGDWRNFDER